MSTPVLDIIKADELIAGDKEKTLHLVWHLVGIHVVSSTRIWIRKLSSDNRAAILGLRQRWYQPACGG